MFAFLLFRFHNPWETGVALLLSTTGGSNKLSYFTPPEIFHPHQFVFDASDLRLHKIWRIEGFQIGDAAALHHGTEQTVCLV